MSTESDSQERGGIGCWAMIGIAAVVIAVCAAIYLMII